MFSPSLAIRWVTASATVGSGRPGELGERRALAGRRVSERRVRGDEVGEPLGQGAESSVRATKSVSQLTSTSTAAPGVTRATTRPSEVARSALLRGRREAALAKDLAGFFEVAAGLDERLLAIHHPDAGLGAQVRHNLRRDFHDSLVLNPVNEVRKSRV